MRPVAAGCYIMRVAKALSVASDGDSLRAYLGELQKAVAVPGGGEAVAWEVRARMEGSEPTFMFSGDRFAAFHFKDREQCLKKGRDHMPHTRRMNEWEYAYDPEVLFCGSEKVYALTLYDVVQMGDPAAPALVMLRRAPDVRADAARREGKQRSCGARVRG